MTTNFPGSDSDVAVSVVILVLSQIGRLQKCLDSIAANHGGDVSHEVIVVANGTPADQVAQIKIQPGVRVVQAAANLGFAGGCNLGARFAKGRGLLFLNDDTEVQAGWLGALNSRLSSDPGIGGVCPKLVGWDGRLQEAGSVVWRNARTDRVGLGATVDELRFQTARDVDSSSACGLLIRSEAWRAVGGFDERFFPAYYEDVDICFSLRQAGYRIVYEPAAVVRHLGSASTSSDLRLYAAEQNAGRFREKWRDELAQRAPFPGDVRLVQAIDALISSPPAPASPFLKHADQVSGADNSEPDDTEITALSMAALQKEVAFQKGFIESELRSLQDQLAKTRRMQRLVARLPIVRTLWRKSTAKL
jgi:GT2 family glycosyltransferase